MYDVSLKRKWDAEAVRQYSEQLDQQLEHTRNELKNEQEKVRREQEKAHSEREKARSEREMARKELDEERSKAEKDKRAIVHNLIVESGMTDEVIMRIVDVPMEFVHEIRTNLEEKN